MTIESHKEVHPFQAEVKQLLHLVIHSLYSHKEIFLRELLSNAQDAADKLRFLALSKPDLLAEDKELQIKIEVDKKAKTLTVSDNGIGMSRDEIIENLGTIASSGTRRFLESLTGEGAKDANLIGQFGVGFYSAFIVALRVVVISRFAELPMSQAVRWESTGIGDYVVETVEKKTRGTDVILHLKPDEEAFLETWQLTKIVTKYSDFIGFPVLMKKTDDGSAYEQINKATALWRRPSKEILESEYQDFYKHITHDETPPLAWMHHKIEGKIDFVSLLYIPSYAPFGLWTRDGGHGLKLYVQRVFILDKADQFLPSYLRFVKGVIDSDDLPLNVSRELLQNNKTVEAIKSAVTRRVLGKLEQLAKENQEQYREFWKEFGLVMKEGPAEDPGNREQIAKLLRFASTYKDTDVQDVSLEDYISRCKPNQKKIYYIAADTFPAAQKSPHLEFFRKNGIEVILLYDRIDEWFVANLHEFANYPFCSVAQGALDLNGLEDNKAKDTVAKPQAEFKDLLEKMKGVLGGRVKEIRLSERLTTSPACLVADENELTAQMERLLKAAGQKVPSTKPILEINPEHRLIQDLKQDLDKVLFGEWVLLVFEQAVLAEGGQLEDPAAFVSRMNRLFESL